MRATRTGGPGRAARSRRAHDINGKTDEDGTSDGNRQRLGRTRAANHSLRNGPRPQDLAYLRISGYCANLNYCLTEPAAKPDCQYFCRNRKQMISGMMAISEPVRIRLFGNSLTDVSLPIFNHTFRPTVSG